MRSRSPRWITRSVGSEWPLWGPTTTDPKYQLGTKNLPVQIDDDETSAGISSERWQGADDLLEEPTSSRGYGLWRATRPTPDVVLTLMPDEQVDTVVENKLKLLHQASVPESFINII